MIKLFLLLGILLFNIACGSKVPVRAVEEFYVTSGVEQYFISNIAQINKANNGFSCHRNMNMRFMNLDKISKEFNYDFLKSLQVQAFFNQEYLGIKETILDPLPFKEEEILFYRSQEKVSNDIKFFNAPNFRKIHLIYVDEVIHSEEKLRKLKSFLRSSIHDDGVPVLVTSCLSKKELQEDYNLASNRSMTLEMFSFYDSKFEIQDSLVLDLNIIFKRNQKIIFYTQDKSQDFSSIIGKFEIRNY